jgi:hypothetical protein
MTLGEGFAEGRGFKLGATRGNAPESRLDGLRREPPGCMVAFRVENAPEFTGARFTTRTRGVFGWAVRYENALGSGVRGFAAEVVGVGAEGAVRAWAGFVAVHRASRGDGGGELGGCGWGDVFEGRVFGADS